MKHYSLIAVILSAVMLLGIAFITSARNHLSPLDRAKIHEYGNAAHPGVAKIQSADSAPIEMLVRIADNKTIDNLIRQGAEVNGIYGDETAVVTIAADKANAISATKGVKSARVVRKLHLTNNYGREMSMVPDTWAGRDLPRGYDGSNTVVGIYDTGIDANHLHFTDNQGNSRVMAIYEYPEGSSIPKEYTDSALISTFTTDDRSQCHGSHVLGTMTGGFYVKGKADYRGVAPGAQIVITTGQGYESQILDAVKRVGEYARAQGLPSVMNLSWGDNIGPHDGSDEFTKALNDLAVEYDMVIACAAGNERDEAIAIVKEFTVNDTIAQTLLLPGISSTTPNQGYGAFQVWSSDSVPFTLHLDVMRNTNPNFPFYTLTFSPGEEKYLANGKVIYDYVSPADSLDIIDNGTAFQKYFTNSFIGGYTGISEVNGNYCADMYAYLNSTNRNSFYIRVRVEGKPGQKIFMYTEDSRNLQFGNNGMSGMDIPDGTGTNSNMASGRHTMSVGSYVSNNVAGTGYPTSTIGRISYFSSYGPTPDGRFVPDLAAPGQVIVSARNQHLSSTYNYSVYTQQDDPISGSKVQFTTMSGTSQATPNAAGCAAIIRQIVPDYSYRQVIDLLKDNCTSPEYDEEGWGSGRINLHAAAMAAVKQSGISGNEADTRDMITLKRHNSEWQLVVPSASRFIIEIFDINGHLIHQIDSYESEHIISTETLPHGIYLLRVTASTQSRTFKISN